MAFIPFPNGAMVELRGTLWAQNIENTLTFHHSGPVTPADLVDLADDIDTWVNAQYLGVMPIQFNYRETYLRSLTAAADYEYTSTANQGDPGTAGAAMPGGTAIVVKFLTSLSGRSFRGRNYLPVVEEAVAGNQVTLGSMTGIVAAYDALLALFPPEGDWQWVVMSKFSNGVPRAAAIGTNIQSVSYTDLDIDSQRRRLTGRGQ